MRLEASCANLYRKNKQCQYKNRKDCEAVIIDRVM